MGFVYLIKNLSTGKYKIGIATDVSRRIDQLSTGSGGELCLVCAIKRDDPRVLESQLHRNFKEKRIYREWFDLNNDDVEYIKKLVGTDSFFAQRVKNIPKSKFSSWQKNEEES